MPNEGMDQGLQPLALRLIGEHDLGDPPSVNSTVRSKNPFAPPGDDLSTHIVPVERRLGIRVGVEDHPPALGEQAGDRGFPASDASGKTEDERTRCATSVWAMSGHRVRW